MHRIKGYRELTQAEVDLMNEGKDLAEQVGTYMKKVEGFDLNQFDGIDRRWLAIGRTHLQQGFMAVIRAIARPTTF